MLLKKNINKTVAIEIFELLEKFAEYGFNKSHAAAYTIISYQTAWLKHYYAIEFLTANISSDINDTDRLVKLLAEAKRMKIKVQAPHINKSKADFTILDKKTIQYGLAAIKNVGYKSADIIAKHRLKKGLFKSIFDLCLIGNNSINKKVLESLILVGACDKLKEHRAQLYESLETIINFSNQYNKNKNSNQESLFNNVDNNIVPPSLYPAESWTDQKCLKYEKLLLGFYLTDNPLSQYQNDIKELDLYSKHHLDKQKIQIGGIITEINYRFDKNGNKWALLSVDTLNKPIQIYVFHEALNKYSNLVVDDMMCFFVGKDFNNNESDTINRMVANQIFPIKGIKNQLIKNINIKLPFSADKKNILNTLNSLHDEFKGHYSLILHLEKSTGVSDKILLNKLKFSIDSQTMKKLRKDFQENNVWLSM